MNAYQPADSIALVLSGEDYFTRLVHLLDQAQETVHLQTYIYVDDDTGRMIANALKRAAQRGVQVWVMADGYGSKELPGAFIQEIGRAHV